MKLEPSCRIIVRLKGSYRNFFLYITLLLLKVINAVKNDFKCDELLVICKQT